MRSLLVDAVLPDLLLRTRAVSARTKNSLHLLHTRVKDLPRHKPANALRARRARQATLVRPELAEVLDRLQRRREVDAGFDLAGRVAEGDH